MDFNARFYSPYLNQFVSPDPIIPDPTNSQSWNRYAYVNGNPLKYTDPTGHCGGVCIGILIAAVVVGMAVDPAEVLAPDDKLAANHPPLNPGYDPVEFVTDYRNGNYIAGTVGLGIEFIPGNDLPGAKQITKGAKNMLGPVEDFVSRAVRKNADSFADIWTRLAQSYAKGTGAGKLYSLTDADGIVQGMMQISDGAHASGALQIKNLEGLGGGAGTTLFQQAVVESQRNFDGAIFLDAKPGSIGWYRKLNPTKMEVSETGKTSFYWSPEDAAKVLNR